MAKKARKKFAAKKKIVKRAKATAKTKVKFVTKNKSVWKPRPKARPRGITDKVASTFHTVVETIKETDALRNKMEPPGTSETS